MTRQRNDDKSTEFGIWLRKQPEIDSSLGYITSNLDYVWVNYKTGEWMLIEEKRYGGGLVFPQQQIFKIIDKCSRWDTLYRGFHMLVFENTCPNDGAIRLDGKSINKDMLIRFLRFEKLKEK